MKKPPKKPSARHRAQNLAEAQRRLPEQRRKHREPQRPQRHQAVLDLAARQIPGREAAQPDADRQRRQQVGRAQLADPQHVLPVINHALLQQRAEEPEVGVAEARQPQHAVPAHHLDLLPQVAQEVGAELLLRVGRRHAGDAEAEGQADHRQPDQHRARPRLASLEALVEHRPGGHAGDDRQERAQLQDAVAPREPLLRQQLRQQPVLRRPEDRAVQRPSGRSPPAPSAGCAAAGPASQRP